MARDGIDELVVYYRRVTSTTDQPCPVLPRRTAGEQRAARNGSRETKTTRKERRRRAFTVTKRQRDQYTDDHAQQFIMRDLTRITLTRVTLTHSSELLFDQRYQLLAVYRCVEIRLHLSDGIRGSGAGDDANLFHSHHSLWRHRHAPCAY